MSFYEFNYLADSFIQVNAPTSLDTMDTLDTISAPSFKSNMLCLPDGTILYATQGDDQYYVYTPDSLPLDMGKPKIDSIIMIDCDTFIATGTLFNGISEGAAYGDDWQMSSNYPLVRLMRNDTVYYTATYNWTSYGVMRGLLPDSTQFVVPDDIPNGVYSLEVVANGNASEPVPFYVCNNVGIKKVSKSANTVIVYPNPANDQATIDFYGIAGDDYTVKVMDMYGRSIKEKTGKATTGENLVSLSLDGINDGTYLVILRNSLGSYSQKLMVRKP
jgi:hypothetical protein